MFESYTYEKLLEEVLNNAPDDIDTRPGSIFYDAVSSGSATTTEDSYSSMGSRSMQLHGSKSPLTSHAAVSFSTVRCSRKKFSSRIGSNTPPRSRIGFAS